MAGVAGRLTRIITVRPTMLRWVAQPSTRLCPFVARLVVASQTQPGCVEQHIGRPQCTFATRCFSATAGVAAAAAGPLEHYKSLATQGLVREDAKQLAALRHLQDLYHEIVAFEEASSRWTVSWGLSSAKPPQGEPNGGVVWWC